MTKRKRNGVSSRGGVDRISALPDPIIHQIFSSLDVNLLVQVSVLSSRWKYLWKSTPFLNFHGNNRNSFSHFVDQVLYCRETSCSIQTFNLTCKQFLKPGHLCKWLLLAIKGNVEHISIDLESGQSVDLAYNLFTSDCLKVLKLRLRGSGSFHLPQGSMFSSNSTLTNLELECIKLPLPDKGNPIFSFPVLKRLVIAGCFILTHLPIFTISAPLLETMALLRMFGDASARTGPINLHLHTPKLKSLFYLGPAYGDFFFDNLSELVSADIYMLECPVSEKYLTSFFKGIYNVEKLSIANSLVKTIAHIPYMLELLPNLLHRLKYVELVDWTTTCIHTMTSFVVSFSHIETLVWSRSNRMVALLSLAVKGEDPMGGVPLEWTFDYLKTIEIRNSHGAEDELLFLEFLLERAVALKSIIIKTSSQKISKIFREKLLKLPRASSAVYIQFYSGEDA